MSSCINENMRYIYTTPENTGSFEFFFAMKDLSLALMDCRPSKGRCDEPKARIPVLCIIINVCEANKQPALNIGIFNYSVEIMANALLTEPCYSLNGWHRVLKRVTITYK